MPSVRCWHCCTVGVQCRLEPGDVLRSSSSYWTVWLLILDGSLVLRATATGDTATAEDIGRSVAEQLLSQGAAEVIDAARNG